MGELSVLPLLWGCAVGIDEHGTSFTLSQGLRSNHSWKPTCTLPALHSVIWAMGGKNAILSSTKWERTWTLSCWDLTIRALYNSSLQMRCLQCRPHGARPQASPCSSPTFPMAQFLLHLLNHQPTASLTSFTRIRIRRTPLETVKS